MVGKFISAEEVGRLHTLLAGQLEFKHVEETVPQGYFQRIGVVGHHGADGQVVGCRFSL